MTPPDKRRPVHRLLLLAGGLFALAAPAAHATLVQQSAKVTVTLGDREGANAGVYAFIAVESRYGLAMEGEMTLTVNGIVRKVDPVATSDHVMLSVNLGDMPGVIDACATFGGDVWLGGDNYQSTQAADCEHRGAPTRIQGLPTLAVIGQKGGVPFARR